MKDIEKLKEIFLSKELDDEEYQDNLKEITSLEQSYIENENLLSWQQHDITKQIIKDAKKTYIELSLKLATDKELTQEKRQSIFAKKDAIEWLMHIGGNDAKDRLNQLDIDIKKALNTTN